ncbi:MAG TPA: invasion associated locus B family protein [Xanthobacteraceae bacterium]|nr:invasion associated locus B family protein [Xanthobacteraceae bacterium]
MAQQPPAAAPAAPAAAKPKPKPKPAPRPAPKPAAERPAAERPAAEAKPANGAQPKLVGQYADWGAYTASPGGKKVCFAISKPVSSQTEPPNRPRNPIYMFISTRPAEKVTNEVSIIIGYPFKPGSEASAQVGTTTFALYTQQDGAWIKNAPEEAQMVDAMRAGDAVIVKGESAKGTKTTDKFDLKGISQALDKVAQECK